MRLFEYTGFAMLTYTIKQGMTGFEPVGEEELVGKMTSGNESSSWLRRRGTKRLPRLLWLSHSKK
jgi:hypothetical protein